MLPPSETIERAALRDLHRAATPELVEKLGLQVLEDGNTLVSIAGALPASAIVINRAMGIGTDCPADQEQLENIVAAYRDAGVKRYFIQVQPTARPEALPGWLEALGLEKARGWQKFARNPDPVTGTATDLTVNEIGAEQGEAFARIVCDGFDLGEVAIPWLARLPGREGWRIFMAFDGDTPAGAGALFLREGYAWTDFAATAPAFRKRGCQAALLTARIRCARESGCREIFNCTGEDVEGDPQHSYNNIKKLGFRETYLQANYAPPKQPGAGQSK